LRWAKWLRWVKWLRWAKWLRLLRLPLRLCAGLRVAEWLATRVPLPSGRDCRAGPPDRGRGQTKAERRPDANALCPSTLCACRRFRARSAVSVTDLLVGSDLIAPLEMRLFGGEKDVMYAGRQNPNNGCPREIKRRAVRAGVAYSKIVRRVVGPFSGFLLTLLMSGIAQQASGGV
jgi:hypothetical protein